MEPRIQYVQTVDLPSNKVARVSVREQGRVSERALRPNNPEKCGLPEAAVLDCERLTERRMLSLRKKEGESGRTAAAPKGSLVAEHRN